MVAPAEVGQTALALRELRQTVPVTHFSASIHGIARINLARRHLILTDSPRYAHYRAIFGNMTLRQTVRDVMAPDVIVAKPGDVLEGVRELMHAHNIHSLPVVDEQGELVGIVTSSDLMPGFSAKIPVSRIMSTDMYTVTPDTDVGTAAQMMREYRIHHVVVIDDNKVVGLLSSLDLLRLIEGH